MARPRKVTPTAEVVTAARYRELTGAVVLLHGWLAEERRDRARQLAINLAGAVKQLRHAVCYELKLADRQQAEEVIARARQLLDARQATFDAEDALVIKLAFAGPNEWE